MGALDRYTSTAMRDLFARDYQLLRLLEASCLAAEVTDAEFELDGELAAEVRRVRDAYNNDRAQDYIEVGEPTKSGILKWLDRWTELEARFDHDIAAVVELVRERLPDSVARYFHLGRTSSDLVDTALAFLITDAQALIEAARLRLAHELAVKALLHQSVPALARTHGQYAELTSVGRRFAVHAVAVDSTGLPPYRFGKLSGPVGVRSTITAGMSLHRVGLHSPPSTQIVPRFFLAGLMGAVAAATVPLSDLAADIRLGSREGADSWVSEARRGDEARGSSSMPTKRNPIRSEKVTGLAAFIRSTAGAVIESVSGLWEERDISHSSVERVGLESVFVLLEHCYNTMADVVRDLEVRPPAPMPSGRFTPARALEYAVVSDGLSYADAYAAVRAQGPERVLRGRGELVNWYDPIHEPGLWGRVHEIAKRDSEASEF